MGDWERQAFWTSWRKINPSMEPSFRHCLPRAMLGAVRKAQKWHGPLSQHWLGEQLSGAFSVPRALLMLGSLRWTGPDQHSWKTNKTRVSKSTLMLKWVHAHAEPSGTAGWVWQRRNQVTTDWPGHREKEGPVVCIAQGGCRETRWKVYKVRGGKMRSKSKAIFSFSWEQVLGNHGKWDEYMGSSL